MSCNACLFFYSDTGFDNAFVFKNITDENITQIEKYIREESLNVRAANLSDSLGRCDPQHECDVLLDEHEMIDIFGKKYANTPSKFKFQPGEIMLIRELVKHAKGIVDRGGENKGLHHFQERKRRAKQIDVTHKRKKNADENAVPFESVDEKKSNGSAITEAEMKSHHSELKSKLFSMCFQYLQAFDLDEQLVMQFNEHMVDLRWKNGAIYGIITCVLCENDGSNKKKKSNAHSVRYYESPSSKYWILSNFKKHMNKVHNLVSDEADLRKKTNRQKRIPLKELNEVNDLNGDKNSIEYIDVPIIDSQNVAEDDIHLVVHSTVDLDCKKTIGTDENWLYTQLSKQISDMVGVVLRNDDVTNNMQFTVKNEIKTLAAASIIGDGNCLPGAICHQLYHDPIGSKEHRKKIRDLRAMVVDYILKPENFPSFQHTLQNRVYDIKSKDEIQDMTLECKLFVRLCLSKDGYWAGHELLVAAAKILEMNVLVFYENGDAYLSNTGTEIYPRTIALAYRLNHDKTEYNHYDSVCDIDSNFLVEIAEKITKI